MCKPVCSTSFPPPPSPAPQLYRHRRRRRRHDPCGSQITRPSAPNSLYSTLLSRPGMAAAIKSQENDQNLERCMRGWLFASASIMNDELRVTLPVWGEINPNQNLFQRMTQSTTFETGFAPNFSTSSPYAQSASKFPTCPPEATVDTKIAPKFSASQRGS